MREFIEKNALAYGIGYIENDIIDQINILNASHKAMHLAIDNLIKKLKSQLSTEHIRIDRIIVDGNRFMPYINKTTSFIAHTCIPKGDSLYLPIAAASILAKVYHDEYIVNLCETDPDLIKYGFLQNMSYGVAKHYKALKEHGATKYHRLSFNLKIND